MPKTGVVAGVYVQAISAFAPHPNAAKLWMEYLYSDEGQLGWLKGYCHPIRFNDLAKNGKIPAGPAGKLPPAEAYAKAVFPTLDEQDAAKEAITKQLGRRRRRQRQVTALDSLARGGRRPPGFLSTTVSSAHDRHRIHDQRCRHSRAAVDRRAASAADRTGSALRRSSSSRCMFLILPTLYLVRRRLSGRRWRFHASRISPTCSQPSILSAYWISHQGQPRLGARSAR